LTQDSGGASVFALQLARVLGARMIAMTSTGAKAEPLKGAQVSVREAAADLEATRPP
jgi:NADPH:quinone reductase-like Zn-dependent oxidoreductase